MSQSDWPIEENVETMESPQSKRFYGKIMCLSLWPSYIGEKGRTLGKTKGIKVKCYYWEHIGNLMGTKQK
jgi:hypothetical protein